MSKGGGGANWQGRCRWWGLERVGLGVERKELEGGAGEGTFNRLCYSVTLKKKREQALY